MSPEPTSTSAPLKKYRGSCHCGAFIYEAEAPEITSSYLCDCSICRKRGYKCFEPEKFTVVRDDGKLTSYFFGNKNFDHQFCSVCGTTILAKSVNKDDPRMGVNLNTIHNFDIWSLKLETYNGAALPPPYVPAKFPGPEPNPEGFENGRVVHGSCHCGTVTLAVKVNGNLDEEGSHKEPILNCNCSFCRLGDYTFFYPTISQLSIHVSTNDGEKPEDKLIYYTFGHRVWRKVFCRTCGVHIYSEANPELTDAEVAALPESVRQFRDRQLNRRPIPVGVLDDVDVYKIKGRKGDGWNKLGPEYVWP
ncbi:hypothetical protein VTJ04DRAFT_4397 [Mycothermus thermophilus]|uniref:uncharacterized protein n=1 Tax=Humicola insolens TaxID=85995 RepID=UPI003743A01C